MTFTTTTQKNTTTTTTTTTETIEGVWIFHRHGDRTPCRPLVPKHQIQNESKFWNTKIPPSRSVYHHLSRRYPSCTTKTKFMDEDHEPYGFLTYRGMNQMVSAGKMCRERYFCDEEVEEEEEQDDDDNVGFLKVWQVKAYSTAYLRTVTSIQCFLDGLLAQQQQQQQQQPDEDTSNNHHYQSLITNNIHHNNKEEEPKIKIIIQTPQSDTLNAFDRNPSLMQKLVSHVVSTPHFQSHDASRRHLADLLCHKFPGLKNKDIRTLGGPSGINWIHVVDHFVCRDEHGLNLLDFMDDDDDDSSGGGEEEDEEEVLRGLKSEVMRHLGWRFHMWYQYKPLLEAIAYPPLRDVMRGVLSRKKNIMDDTTTKRPLVVFSCHDVTILSLLHGLKADLVVGHDEEANVGQKEEYYWPEYATTLMFELVRQRRKNDDDEDDDDEDQHHFFVRVLLNGETISMEKHDDKHDGFKFRDTLTLEEFTNVVEGLEGYGGMDMEDS